MENTRFNTSPSSILGASWGHLVSILKQSWEHPGATLGWKRAKTLVLILLGLGQVLHVHQKGFLLKYSGLGFVAWGLGALTWTSSLILHFWCLPKELIMFSDRSHSTGAGFNGYKFRAMLWGCFV